MGKSKDRTVSSGSQLVKGVAILGAAALVSKLLGTLQKIPLQNIAGDEVFGIYNVVYPLYILILLLATAGFPIAVSKFVSEYASEGRMDEAERMVRLATVVLTATGIVFFLLLFFGAERLAAIIGNTHTGPAIRSVSFALLFVPIMATMRGYFQGLHHMVPTGISQVVEQTVRVATMLGLILILTRLDYSADWVAAGATFGAVTGAVAGLAVMLYYWIFARQKHKPRLSEPTSLPKRTNGQLLKRFTSYALPICLGSIVLPILNLADSFTLPRLLAAQGLNEVEAMREFGIYGRGLPLVQLVGMVATSMSVALVPAIAAAKKLNQGSLIRGRTEVAMRLTWLIGCASSVGLAAAVVPLNVMFYTNSAGSATMAILAFTALFSVVNIVSGTILQGTGAVIVPALHILIAAVVKIVGNIVLLPIWGIKGAAVSAVLAFAVAAVLNVRSLSKHTGVSFNAKVLLLRPMKALGVMVLVVWAIIYCVLQASSAIGVLSVRWENTVAALLAVTCGAAAYTIALFRSGALSENDLKQVPSLYGTIKPLLIKLRLLER